jgi:hypothetical protein
MNRASLILTTNLDFYNPLSAQVLTKFCHLTRDELRLKPPDLLTAQHALMQCIPKEK